MATLTFLGHGSFRLDVDGVIVYLDPWLEGNPVCPPELKKVDRADVIAVTHGHQDHLDPDLPKIAEATGASIVTSPMVMAYLAKQGVQNLEFLGKGGTATVKGIKFTMTDALHQSSIRTEEMAGYPHEAAGFLLRAENLPTLYFAGDTGIFSGMELLGKMYQPEVALLPIGDRATMGPYEAAWATRLLGVKKVVPMHFGTFPFLTGTAEQFKEELKNDPVEVIVLEPGQSTDL